MEIQSKFINAFGGTHLQGTELRVSNTDVKQFLKNNSLSMSFREFNELAGCKGRTTGNLYAYDMGVLSGQPVPIKAIPRMTPKKDEYWVDFWTRQMAVYDKIDEKFERSAKRWVTTLNWYGSKRLWLKEFSLFYVLASHLGCTNVVDCFAGSGFLGLLASRTGFFEKVTLNEASSKVYNFHNIMKDICFFKPFVEQLEDLGKVSKDTFLLYRQALQGSQSSVAGKEKRQQVKNLRLQEAIELFVVKHYSFQGQGSYTSKRKAPATYVKNLWKTHELYSIIELKNLHYLKVLKQALIEENTLVLLDPPYLQTTRVQKKSYGLEFTERQHRTMLQLLTSNAVDAKVLVCGYNNELYNRYFQRATQTWHCVRLKKAGKRGEKGKEHIWCNFEVSEMLIDYGDLFELVY